MACVLREHRKAVREQDPDTVHDLRVALRRCRSMVDGLMEIDSDAEWPAMKKAGRKLFRRLGALRDTQVMIGWVKELAPAQDAAGMRLLEILRKRDLQQKDEAKDALNRFDRVQWKTWAKTLPKRAHRVAPDGPVFQEIALQRWEEAHALHRKALRNRSQLSWHQLRIGVKRFRYVVENFLPSRHAQWGSDLKEIQDLLGEVHDLDVLWPALRETGGLFDAKERERWQAILRQAREERLANYRERMTGKSALWKVWRGGLPQGEALEKSALEKLSAWAAFIDGEFEHAKHVARLALNLFDGLAYARVPGPYSERRNRWLLHAAALAHNVGHTNGHRGHHKASYRLIREVDPPLGWTAEDLLVAALVARYHRGAPPRNQHHGFAALPPVRRETVLHLGGILRLAAAFDHTHKHEVTRLVVQNQADALLVWAQGYAETQGDAQILAAERHLLERALRKPVVIRPRPTGPRRAVEHETTVQVA
jgi:CHAD domain-containing protein